MRWFTVPAYLFAPPNGARKVSYKMPVHTDPSFELGAYWQRLTRQELAQLAGEDMHAYRLAAAFCARPGDVVRYRTTPQWELHEGRVTAKLRGPDGRPVLVLDNRVAITHNDIERASPEMLLAAGDRCHRLGPASMAPSVVEAVEGTAAAPFYRLRDVFTGAMLHGRWPASKVRVLQGDRLAEAS